MDTQKPVRVLVLGGGFAGLSAVMNGMVPVSSGAGEAAVVDEPRIAQLA